MIPALRVLITLFLVMPLFSCAGRRPANLGVKDARLAPCPSSPNCVSSDDADPAHRIAPLEFAIPAGEAWRAVRSVVGG
ncbi:MAG TPA: DUF1499 domain-containing protein, partial [Candidatus Saccharimonadales bacterium]|nr:DUF1499 domain-containing protein [Candidatus Saccharimonadales bacterium]